LNRKTTSENTELYKSQYDW